MPGSEGPAAATDASLAASYVRRSLVQLVLGVAAVALVLGVTSALYGEELATIATWASDVLGVAGLALFVFLVDGFTLPIPPDAVLVVVANGPLEPDWIWVVTGFGLVSALAGNVGYGIARAFAGTAFVTRALGPHRDRMEAVFARYGALAVALGALTPIPFSVTCWVAGVLRLRWSVLAWTSLLRVPRFLAYYWLIAASSHLGP